MSDKKYSVLIVTEKQNIRTYTDDPVFIQSFQGVFRVQGEKEVIFINLDKVESVTVKDTK